MANRTVEVILKLRTDAYKAEAEAAKRATEGLDRSVEATDRDLKKIPPDAAKAAAAMKLLGEGTGAAQAKFDGLGKSTSTMQTLDRQIVHTRDEVRKLADEFNRTKNAGVLQKLFSTQGDLGELENLKKRLTNALGDAGKTGGQEFTKNVSAAVQGTTSTPGIGAVVVGALIAAAVVASPFLIAAVNGALLAGVGLGGLAIGIVGQIHDPAVHAALVDFGHGFMDELTRDTVSFRQPLINALATIGDALKHVLSGIDFSQLAGALGPLSRGIAGMFKGMDLSAAFAAAVPLVNELARDLPMVGQAIGIMFDQMAKGGQGAKEGLRSLLMVLSALLIATGVLIRGFSDLYQGIVGLGDAVSGFFQKWVHGIAQMMPFLAIIDRIVTTIHELWHEVNAGKDPVETLGRSLKDTGSAAALTADEMSKYTSEIHHASAQTNDLAGQTSTLAAAMSERLFTVTMNVQQAVIGWHRSLLNLHDVLTKNGKAIDKHTGLISLNTKAGLDNRDALLQMMTANMAMYQSQVAVGVKSEIAAKQYDANTQSIYAMGRQAHLTDAQIHDVIGSLQGIPHKTEATIAVEGLTKAIADLDETIRLINGLHGRTVTIDVVTRNTMINNINQNMGHPNAMGSIRRAQIGMLIPPSNPGTILAAEPQTGGEALIPLQGISAGRAATLGQIALGGYGLDVVPRGRSMRGGGGGTFRHEFVFTGSGAPAEQALGTAVMNGLRTGWIQVKTSQLIPG